MSNHTSRGFASLIAPCLWAFLMALSVSVGQAQDTFQSDYAHVVYNVSSNSPVRIYGGKMALDLTTRERWLQVLSELKDMGLSVTTPLTSYGPQTIYPTAVPGLRQCAGWADRNLDGLQMLLDACAELELDCYPAVWLFRAATPELSAAAMRELFERYGSHPAFKGFVPPVEANPQGGFESADFVDLSRLAKQLDPAFSVMDYPNGPFSPEIVQTIIARSLSSHVDIENVQFHPSDHRWDGSFLFARGLFHLVLGICPQVRSIVHTHYKYGGGMRWIELDDLYRVHQAATLTATPHGTSIYSFLHAMWGNASSGNLDDPLLRRLAWYKGITTVQRMVPYFENARPANAVAIMIPRYIGQSSLAYLQQTYMPLAQAGVGVHCFVDDSNMGATTRGIVVARIADCSSEQLRLLQSFVEAGGALCVLAADSSPASTDYSPRARRVLGVHGPRKWEPTGLEAGFSAKLGLDDATGKTVVPTVRETPYGKGTIFAAPEAEAADLLPDWVATHVPRRAIAHANIKGFCMDRWRKADARTSQDIIMFMGTEPGASAQDVAVSVPCEGPPRQAFLLQPDTVRPLAIQAQEGCVRVTMPSLGDEFNALILTDSTYPFLLPAQRVIRCKVGQTVPVEFSVHNALSQDFQQTVKVVAPRGWGQATPSSFSLNLPPGEGFVGQCSIAVPSEAIRRPHFLRLECSGLIQRVILFPEDGRPQVFSNMDVSQLAGSKRPARPPRPPSTIGNEWLSVSADELNGQNVPAHRPGVCLLPSKEWDPPATHEGKKAWYGERLPRLGGPNFIVNDPPDADIELRITYWTQSEGTVHVYDGRQYHDVLGLRDEGRWASAMARVPRKLWQASTADRPQHPGVNIMFDVDCAAVYVHSIEVRKAP